MQPNPYSAPVADLTLRVEDIKKSIWWKIYFFFATIIDVLGLFEILSRKEAGWPDYLSVPLFLIGTMGTFGYVFNKRILTPKFWLYFLIVSLGFSIAYYFLTEVDFSAGMSQGAYLISSIFGWLVSAPGYYAIFRYSSSSNVPWRNCQ